MDGKQAKVLISVSDGRVEFEGTEEFVERQLVTFGDLVKQSLQAISAAPKKQPPVKNGKSEEQGNQGAENLEGLAAYENLFVKDAAGEIQILKDLPGTNKSQKMVNAALLLALANTLIGKSPTSFKEIRNICKKHGALDSTNFAQVIKGCIEDFVFDGTGQSITVALTVPGRKAADKLAAELNK
jgi:hypothetical protein